MKHALVTSIGCGGSCTALLQAYVQLDLADSMIC